MPDFPLPEGHLYYEEAGSGPNLLLLAGAATDLQSWVFQTGDLARVARVLALDHRGAGRSSSPPGPHPVEAMADDAAAFLRREGPAVVVGHSLGGFVAQQLALRHPDLVRGLVLACTCAHLDPFSLAVLDSWRAWNRAGLSREAFARGFFPWIFSRRFFEDPSTLEMAVRLYVENPYPQAPEDLDRQVEACRGHDTRSALRDLRVPALVLVAGEDLLTPPLLGRALAESLPQARLRLLPGGHAVMNEDPEGFNSAVREFLRSLP